MNFSFTLVDFAMKIYFGPWIINPAQVFYETSLSLGIVNLKPIVPGHVLIIPKRVEPRLMELTAAEYDDLFKTVRAVAPKLEAFYAAEAMNIAVQDGAAAGQSVPHVHVHILPRKTGTLICSMLSRYLLEILNRSILIRNIATNFSCEGDFSRNDDVYEELDRQNLNEVFKPDSERRPRTLDEMAAESDLLRKLFEPNQS